MGGDGAGGREEGDGRVGGSGEGAGDGMDEVEAVRLEKARNGEGGTLERELARVQEEDLLAEVVRESLRDG